MQTGDSPLTPTQSAHPADRRAGGALAGSPRAARARHLASSQPTGLFARLKGFFARLFGRRQAAPLPPARPLASAEVVSKLAQLSRPIVFRQTDSTLISPMGSYAGKASVQNLRQMAEEEFHTMQPTRGATIN